MKYSTGLLFFLIAVLTIGLLGIKAYEAFTSDGTLLQLATSHVPTAEDVRVARRERRRIHRDLIDLT